jgi:hypothetical protein
LLKGGRLVGEQLGEYMNDGERDGYIIIVKRADSWVCDNIKRNAVAVSRLWDRVEHEGRRRRRRRNMKGIVKGKVRNMP